MNERLVYEALAQGKTVETVLPDLAQALGAKAVVLYYLGETEASLAFESATPQLLEQMKRRLIDEIRNNGKFPPARGEELDRVELALAEADLLRLGTETVPMTIQVHLVPFGRETLGALALAFPDPKTNGPKKNGDHPSIGQPGSNPQKMEGLLVSLSFAHRIGAILQADEEVKSRLEHFALVGRVFSEGLSIDQTLARLLEIALSLVGAGIGVVVVNPSPGETPIKPISWGMPPDWVALLRFGDGRGFMESVLAGKKPIYLENLEPLDSSSCPKFLQSLAAIPLVYEGGILGCLFVVNPPPRFFEAESEHRALGAMASLAGGAIRSARHLEAELRSERLREEVRLAAHVQAKLLPQPLTPSHEIEIAVVIQPANYLGGDFYDIFELGDGKWGVIVADVSGKGMSAAMLMATARAYLHAFAMEEHSPCKVFQRMNRALARDFADGRFLTAVYMIVDVPSGRIQMTGAGHHPVFLLKPDGNIDCIPCDDFPLGIFLEGKFTESNITVQSGTTILIYTDGLVEAAAPDGRFFGSERMHAVLTSLNNISPQQMIDRLLEEVKTWTGRNSFRDDLTALVLKIK